MALTDDLVSYWKLDETSGTRADSHGSNDLTDNNTVGYGTGKISNGADFEQGNGDESLSIADASQSGLDITGDMSFSMWIKIESYPGPSMVPLGKPGAYITVLDYNNFSFVVYDASSNATSYTDPSVYTAGSNWYHIVGVYDSSTPSMTIYLNGSDGSATQNSADASSIANTANPFYLGANGTTNEFDGIIDEVGIWSRQLTSDEVTELYNSGDGLDYDSFGGGGGGDSATFFGSNF